MFPNPRGDAIDDLDLLHWRQVPSAHAPGTPPEPTQAAWAFSSKEKKLTGERPGHLSLSSSVEETAEAAFTRLGLGGIGVMSVTQTDIREANSITTAKHQDDPSLPWGTYEPLIFADPVPPDTANENADDDHCCIDLRLFLQDPGREHPTPLGPTKKTWRRALAALVWRRGWAYLPEPL